MKLNETSVDHPKIPVFFGCSLKTKNKQTKPQKQQQQQKPTLAVAFTKIWLKI